MNTTLTNDLCNEVRDLRERLAAADKAAHVAHADFIQLSESLERRMRLLTAVLDAGRPHSHLCGCDSCNAWLAVRKELRGE